MEGFVLGGSVTQIRNYPHSVYLNIICNASFICGGSVLNQLVVLTAAHCLEECRRPSSDDVFIKYGHENLDKMWSTRMKGFVMHEYYHDALMENDIALVTSVRALPLGHVVQRVVLVQQTPNIKLGFMAGWGVMNAKKDSSWTLLDVVQELQPPKVCRLVGPMPRGAFCAGPITGTGAPDLGDSGSALMVKRFIQIGLVSYKKLFTASQYKRAVISRMFGPFFSIVLLSLCVHKTSSKMEGFVVGGSQAGIENHPHSAFLEMSCPAVKDASSWICGASVLNQQFALTAAHCVHECSSNGAITVVVGNEKRTQGSMTTVLKIKSHEYYNDVSLVNDIALIMVRKAFRLSNRVQRVILMKNAPVSTEAVVAGWGITDEIKSTGTILLKFAKQTIISRNECAITLGERLDDRLLCAGSWRGNDYAAAGDSGSALMIRGYIQIGLVSHKYSRVSRSLVLYTNVSYHYDWIVRHTHRLYCDSQLKNQIN